MSLTRLVCSIGILSLSGCQLFPGVAEFLDPVALEFPHFDSSPWEIFVEHESLTHEASTFDLLSDAVEGKPLGRTVDGGRVVEVNRAGAITLIVLDTAEILDARNLGAVAVAWSSSADRIAVVTRDASLPAAQAHSLLILDESLDEQMRFALDLPLADELSDYRTFVVSWRADDSEIAVSTDAIPGDCSILSFNSSVLARCLVVTVADGVQSSYELTNVYFLDDGWVVGSVPDGPRVDTSLAELKVFAMRLENGEILERVLMQGSEFALASYAPDGVFASVEGGSGLFPECNRKIHLRTRTGRSRQIIERWTVANAVSLFPSAP